MAKKEVVIEIKLEDRTAFQKLGVLETQIKADAAALKELNKQVLENGVATKEDVQQIGELTAALKDNRSQSRELSNELGNLTSRGERFRDKMAQATLEAIRNSGALGQLDAKATALAQEITKVNTAFSKGEVNAEEYRKTIDRLETELGQTKKTAAEAQLKFDALEAEFKSGKISAEQFRKSVDGLNDEIKTQGTNITGAVNSLKGYAIGILAIYQGAVQAIAAFKELSDLAGTIEKTDARIRTIAGETLPLLTAAAEANANAIGLTRREYLALAVDQQLRLKNLGIEAELSAELAVRTVETADALADFSGGTLTAEQASGLLNDALTGQTKGLKALGINVKASKGELEALSAEFQLSKGVTQEQGDALANLELVFRSTQSALTDFKDETLSMDEAQDAATAKFREAKEALAVALTPAFITANDAAANFITTLTDGIGNLQSGEALRGFAQVFDTLLVSFKAIVTPGAFVAELFKDDLPKAAEKAAEANEFIGASLDTLRGKLDLAIERQAAFNKQGKADVAAEFQPEIDALTRIIKAREQTAALVATTAKKQAEAAKVTEEGTNKQAKAVENVAGSVADLRAQIVYLQKQQAQSTTSEQFDTYEGQLKSLNEQVDTLTGKIKAVPSLESLDFTPQDTDIPPPPTEEETLLKFGVDPNAAAIVEAEAERVNALLEEQRINDIQGIRDFDVERAILDADFKAGRIESQEEYNAQVKVLQDAEQQQMLDSQAAALGGIANFLGALQGLVDQGSEQFKALATTQALINTYLGAAQVLGTPSTLPEPFATISKIANFAAVIASGLGAVKKIQGFAEGGFTGRGDKYEPAGIVHKGEYVVPKSIVQDKRYAHLLEALEDRRMRGYAQGGPVISVGRRLVRGTALVNLRTDNVPRPSPNTLLSVQQVAEARAYDQTVVARISEINSVQGRTANISELSRA